MYEQLSINEGESCALCGFPFSRETLVLVESGSVAPRKKDHNTGFFLADWRLPVEEQPDCPVLQLYHFHCFQQLAQGEPWKVNPTDWECHLCDQANFRTSRWAFQVTVGQVEDSRFYPDPEIPKQGIICVPCTVSLFGEGDDETGELLLYGA